MNTITDFIRTISPTKMPGIENGREGNCGDCKYNENPADYIQQPVREITLTDKLNKKLLEAFLQRFNEGSVQQLQSIYCSYNNLCVYVLNFVQIMDPSIDLYAEEYADDYAEAIEDNVEQEIENENQTEGVENEEQEDKENKKVKPKRIIKNPRPKLDLESLKSHKGLLYLEHYFKNKKFKGKGHEEEDLRIIMKTYEYWCHRLFPKFSFDDCLAKLEKLGTKKNVQVYLKRLRMDLVFDDDQPITNEHEEELVNEISEPQFDDLFPSVENREVEEFPSLTEEQLERIRINKEKANHLRQEKLQINNTDNLDTSKDSNKLTNLGNDGDSGLQSQPEISQNKNDESSTQYTNTNIDCE
ncbi:hypothetical protein Trydic_g4426 [Trypoxylus dichotomus]